MSKFFFYCFLSCYFRVNNPVTMSKFINFYCKLVTMKIKINSVTQNTVYILHIFSFKYFFYWFYCFCLILILWCSLNPSLYLILHESGVLPSITIVTASCLCKYILFDCVFGTSTYSYLCFLYFEGYFFVLTGKCLWSNPSFISFLFNHFIPLSTITSTPFFLYFFSNDNHFILVKFYLLLLFSLIILLL